ncbi:carbohydrate ABC transporter permease [Cohnella cellulosilytica]|uniref:Carbohydrate ABC transporter permease n=1 Tax=Cohnella cellulosilytica TaxID=986710 RepID=A0ABW2FQ49_9BACL
MKATFTEKLFYAFNYTLLGLIGLSCVIPMIHMLALSLSTNDAILSGFVGLWPVGWNFETYYKLFTGTHILQASRNSIEVTVIGTLLSMLFTILCAYPLSRKYMYGRRFFTFLIVFTMIFGGGLIPTYLVVKSLGLVNTYGALWLPGLISVYNMLVMRTFLDGIPEEIEEAARIDGCGEMRMLLQVILPLSLPVIAALTLFYGVGYWNAFFSVMIYINDSTKNTLAVLVQQMISSQQLLQEVANTSAEDLNSITPESIKAAGVFVMIVPMLVIYPFLQKYFVKGVMIGSVKG